MAPKKKFTKGMLWRNQSCKESKIRACSLANTDTPVAAILQLTSFSEILCVIIIKTKISWWTFGIFFFRSGGEGGVRGARNGGDRFFLIEDPRRGFPRGEGPMGPGGCLRRIGNFCWGGG